MGKWGNLILRAILWLLKMFVRDGVAAEVSSPSPCPSQPVVLPFSFGPTLHTQMIRGCFLGAEKAPDLQVSQDNVNLNEKLGEGALTTYCFPELPQLANIPEGERGRKKRNFMR